MKYPLTPPKFPEDFKILYTDGGASYWHWHPDAPPDYDGTWPAGEAPPWVGGVCISSEESVGTDLEEACARQEVMVVVWEFGFELESGAYRNPTPTIENIQRSVNEVIAEVNEEHQMNSSL